MDYVKTTELYHHGVLGQKWGVRNGPPYPLSSSQKSSAEKKAAKVGGVGKEVKKRAAKAVPDLSKGIKKAASTVSKGVNKGVDAASDFVTDRTAGGAGGESKMAKLRRNAADNIESIQKAPYKSTLQSHFSKDERKPSFSELVRHPAKSIKQEYQVSAENFAKDRTVGQIITQTVLTQIGLAAAATAINVSAHYLSKGNEDVEKFVNQTVNGVFGSLSVINAAVGITAAVQKGRGRYDNKDRVYGGVKDMSDAELKEYNTRRGMEEKYKEYQKKDDTSMKRLNTASDIANKTRDAYNASERSINDMFREKHQQQKNSIDLSNMSDDELRKRVNRMNMERQYRDLTPAEVTKGERAVNTAMSIVGPALAATASALSIAVGVKTLMNKTK